MGSRDPETLLRKIASMAASSSELDVFVEGVLGRLHAHWNGCELRLFLVDPNGVVATPGEERSADVDSEQRWQSVQGLLQEVVGQQCPLRLDDVPAASDTDAPSPSFRSALAVPLHVGDRVIGVLSAMSEQVAAFDESDEDTMMALAPLVAVALENRRLIREATRSAEELQLLRRLTREMVPSSNIDRTLDHIVTHLADLVGCRGCSIALMDPEGDVLRIRAAMGISEEWQRDFELKLGEGVAGRVAQDGQPEYVADAFELDDFIFFDPAVRSLLSVPIRSGKRIVGTLSVDSNAANAFSATDEALLCVVAALVGSVLEDRRLYTELEKRDDDLRNAYKQLHVLAQSRDEMVQNVSHELRTPLTFVKGYVDLLLVEEVGSLNQDQRKFLEIVARRTTQLIGQVRNLIFLQQLDYIPAVRQPVSLAELVWQSEVAARDRIERTGITIVSDIPEDMPLVAGDDVALLEVLEHLLDNALKFSPQGGVVKVTAEDIGDAVRVSVTDQGIGISEDYQKLVFEPFYQIDGSARRHYGGCGIGLSVARRIVEGHGGEMGLVSKIGVGSTFFFTLPKDSVSVPPEGIDLASSGSTNIPH